ncbi:hypothetical protein [Sulfurisphaera tokodaii]|uniref:Uncharacterized protein n=1 Tax=Sulfurisphaera tokodaii TaxID=111955 RepID=A0A832WUA7_9CREN|nr:hypothetical protein [Sulfurisphaera tokodaii]HII75274.1 hypothetical protein [Sulfurisphaera tokodaii]
MLFPGLAGLSGLAIVYRESVKKAITNPIVLLLMALAFLESLVTMLFVVDHL